MLVVDPSSVVISPHVMPNIPRLRLYDLLGCSVGYLFIVLCLRGSLSRQFVCSVISWNITISRDPLDGCIHIIMVV